MMIKIYNPFYFYEKMNYIYLSDSFVSGIQSCRRFGVEFNRVLLDFFF